MNTNTDEINVNYGALSFADERSAVIAELSKSESEIQRPLSVKKRRLANDSVSFEDAPAVKLVDLLIKEAFLCRASDIHIEPYEKKACIRFRIDGELTYVDSFPIKALSEISARIKIMAQMDIAEKRLPQDGHINAELSGELYDIRVSTLPTVYGEKFVLRILDKSRLCLSRSEIGFSDADSETVNKILSHNHGIVLLCGPTGCGKSTTLYSFLKEINQNSINITTVEDPVEYTIEGINQIQINPKIELTFASVLRSVLRQDPDVIMVGEIRDEETAQIAVRAAITGHLVFSTLHTNDAPGALTRLVNMGVSPYLVGDSVVAVISQRLVKRLCPKCKAKVKASESEKLMLDVDISKDIEIYQKVGCEHCLQSGYRGRIAVHEIMCMSKNLRETLAKGDFSALSMRENAEKEGMKSIENACREKVLEGVCDIPELVKLMSDSGR